MVTGECYCARCCVASHWRPASQTEQWKQPWPPGLCLPVTHLCCHKLCIFHIHALKNRFCCTDWKISPESKFNWSQGLEMKLLDVWVSGMLLYLLLRSLNQFFSYKHSRSHLLSTVLASPVTPGCCRSLQQCVFKEPVGVYSGLGLKVR